MSKHMRNLELRGESALLNKRFGVDMSVFNTLPENLQYAIKHIYSPLGLSITKITKEADDKIQEYGGYRFSLQCEKGSYNILFRQGKLTPKYQGHFVTTWVRVDGKPEPLQVGGDIDFFVISVSAQDSTHGQFIFDRNILGQQGVLSSARKKGKLGFRIFAPWTKPPQRSAQKAQQWQSPFFLPLGSK